MTQVIEHPELEMELELELIQKRYKEMASTSEIEMDGGVTAKGVGGTSTAAYVSLYSTKDGTVSTVTTDAAKKKVISGNFALRPNPAHEYKRDQVTGRPIKVNPRSLKCRLHVNADDREWLNQIGLADRECTKDNIPSQFMLQQHMDKKHHQEWLSIQREEAATKDEEGRELQRAQVEAMRAMAGGNQAVFKCRLDGCARFFDTDEGRKIHEGKPHN